MSRLNRWCVRMPGGRGKREAARSTKRKLSGRTKGTGDGERWEEGGGDKRNVESKKQKEKRNIKVRLAGARRRWGQRDKMGDGKRRDIAGWWREGISAKKEWAEEIKMTEDKSDRAETKWYGSDGWIAANEWDNDGWLWWRCVVISERVIGSEKLLLHLSCVPRYKWLFNVL